MAHIKLPEGAPGILGPMLFSPETAKPMNELAEVLLRGPNTLTSGEREMIATYVSSENDCYFCQSAHGAVAAHHLGGNEKLVHEVKLNFESAAISDKMKALLVVAGKVQKGASKCPRKTSPGPVSKGQPTKRSMTRCSSLRHSACTTATWTAWRPGHRAILKCIARTADGLPHKAM